LLVEVNSRRLKPYHAVPYLPLMRAGDVSAKTLRLPGYRQTRGYCCGFASALMVLRYFGATVPGQELFSRLGTARDGTRQGAIVRELRAAGLRVNLRYDVGFERVRTEIDRDKLIIGYLTDAEHWVVIYGYAVDPERLFVADPRPDEGCDHAWASIEPRLGQFGMVCSRPGERRAPIAAAPVEAPAPPLPEPDPEDSGQPARPVQLSFDFR